MAQLSRAPKGRSFTLRSRTRRLRAYVVLTMTERTAEQEFLEADAEFSVACRAYNEASDKFWKATQKRSAAWRKLERTFGEHGDQG